MSDYTTSVAFRADKARPSVTFFKEIPPEKTLFVRGTEDRVQMQAWVTQARLVTQDQTIT